METHVISLKIVDLNFSQERGIRVLFSLYMVIIAVTGFFIHDLTNELLTRIFVRIVCYQLYTYHYILQMSQAVLGLIMATGSYYTMRYYVQNEQARQNREKNEQIQGEIEILRLDQLGPIKENQSLFLFFSLNFISIFVLVTVLPRVADVRPHILCCVVRNINYCTFNKHSTLVCNFK